MNAIAQIARCMKHQTELYRPESPIPARPDTYETPAESLAGTDHGIDGHYPIAHEETGF